MVICVQVIEVNCAVVLVLLDNEVGVKTRRRAKGNYIGNVEHLNGLC